MADYRSVVRSSYVEVRNRAAFDSWCLGLDLTVVAGPGPLVGFVGERGLPHRPASDGASPFTRALAALLAPGWSVTVLEVGAEDLRSVQAYGFAVSATGVVRDVDLVVELSQLASSLGHYVPSE
jgi:hypothetical protein